MILVELEIEDYKQFAGLHRFTPSSDGIIAIIGHNGAGKTTLFEAIEWCLYQPREIASDEVAPRGKVAKPRVKLTLLDPETGKKFVIVRSLSKSRIADAEIYVEDESDTRIVKGSRQSTEHISKTLIGLSHRAFVSTFFTRQKELTFFGDLKETDRRREVGRLLGMETIRDAQKLIGDERAELVSQAKALELQHREVSQGRDFAQEAEDAVLTVQSKADATARSRVALGEAETEFAQARAEIVRLTALERNDADLRTQIERIDGDIRAVLEKLSAAEAALRRIEEVAAERSALAKVAEQLEPRAKALEAQEQLRHRFQTRQQLERELAKSQKEIADALTHLRNQVTSTCTPSLPAWRWHVEDDRAPLNAVDRLIPLASGLDLTAESARVSAMERLLRLSEEKERAEKSVHSFQLFRDKLKAELDALSVEGDPLKRIQDHERERETALKYLHETESRLTTIAEEIARLFPVRERLMEQKDGAICPTCGRPIELADVAITLELFNRQINTLEQERNTINRERPLRTSRVTAIDGEIESLRKRASEIDALKVRIETGNQRIAETEEEAQTKQSEFSNLLETQKRTTVPTMSEIEQEVQRIDSLRAVSSSQALLHRLSVGLRNAIENEIDLTAELSSLGEVSYDPKVHEEAKRSHSDSDRAAARIAQIDSLLLQQADRIREIEEAGAALLKLRSARERRQVERISVGFDPAALAEARKIEEAAIALERVTRDRLSVALADHQKSVAAHETLIDEHKRIGRLIERSEARAREAGQLDLMYREFNAFEQFVADRLTPQLSDYTSELLRAITDGKYDQVWFNSNYGIEVFDGDDEHFPVEEFSGGERDVIALCARLALSRLIGTQASNPPGFMVLDEVFGSLDRERRAQVLETLGALAGSADAFHQLFIISHVDDVRSSPIFNEVWRVSEGPDGVSHLENLNLTGGFDDA